MRLSVRHGSLRALINGAIYFHYTRTTMATITAATLSLLDHDHAKKTARIRVSYKALLSTVERNMSGLRFKEKIQLWGSDPGPDDYLYSFPTSTFAKESDGSVSRSRTVTLADDILDEDGFFYPTDEVYARISISALLPSGDTRNSNQIQHKF